MEDNPDLLYELKIYFELIRDGKSDIAYQKVQDLVFRKKAKIKNKKQTNKNPQAQYISEKSQLEELIKLEIRLEMIENLELE